jgi:hypothetical protein
METDFRALLAGDGTLAGLVSSRITPSTYAQGTSANAVRYQKVTGSTGLHMQGSDGLNSALMQVDVRAANAIEALAIRDAIVSLLHGFRGEQGTTAFQLIQLRDDRGVSFEETGAEKFYTTSLDFDVWSRAAA